MCRVDVLGFIKALACSSGARPWDWVPADMLIRRAFGRREIAPRRISALPRSLPGMRDFGVGNLRAHALAHFVVT
jgi:hypothetical protein